MQFLNGNGLFEMKFRFSHTGGGPEDFESWSRAMSLGFNDVNIVGFILLPDVVGNNGLGVSFGHMFKGELIGRIFEICDRGLNKKNPQD